MARPVILHRFLWLITIIWVILAQALSSGLSFKLSRLSRADCNIHVAHRGEDGFWRVDPLLSFRSTAFVDNLSSES